MRHSSKRQDYKLQNIQGMKKIASYMYIFFNIAFLYRALQFPIDLDGLAKKHSLHFLLEVCKLLFHLKLRLNEGTITTFRMLTFSSI